MFNIYGILIWASKKPQKIEKKFLVQIPPSKISSPPPLHLLTLFGKPCTLFPKCNDFETTTSLSSEKRLLQRFENSILQFCSSLSIFSTIWLTKTNHVQKSYLILIFTPFCPSNTRSSHRKCSMKNGALKNFAKFTEKHLCQSLFFSKVVGLLSSYRNQSIYLNSKLIFWFLYDGNRPATLLRIRLWHRCFPVNFAEFLRIHFYTSGHLRTPLNT